MKLSHLKQIITHLQNVQKIAAIYRVNDTTVKVVFDKDNTLYFDMQRSNSKIFKAPSYPRSKIYNAPFDVVLAKRFNRANILNIELLNSDKIIRFKTSLSSAYKEQISYLQFEFTGKYTNVILLDSDFVVLEALRHIDLFSSFREVRVGQKLLDVPPAPFQAKEYPLEDVEKFLYEVYEKEQEQKLASLKKQKISFLEKKLKKLQKLYNKLDSKESLEEEAKKYEHLGNLVLFNQHTIKPYAQTLVLKDYDNTQHTIELTKGYANPFMISEMFFNRSKKAKQKAKHLHIEEESLRSKIEHIKLFIHTVQEAKESAKSISRTISILINMKKPSSYLSADSSSRRGWIYSWTLWRGYPKWIWR